MLISVMNLIISRISLLSETIMLLNKSMTSLGVPDKQFKILSQSVVT